MRCYNRNCDLWTKQECDNGNCTERIASKDKAIEAGAWLATVTVHQIGTSLGVYLPKAICDRKGIEVDSELVVSEKEDGIELTTPPTSENNFSRK